MLITERMRQLAGLTGGKRLSDVDAKEGRMHKILDVPEGQKISDVYSSPKAAVDKLIKAVGRQKAAQMINWAANVGKDPFIDAMQAAL